MSPCHNCQQRKPTCHDRCDEYMKYHDALLEEKSKKSLAYAVIDYIISATVRRNKK